MTVSELRAMLAKLERQGLGWMPVTVQCEASADCPDGVCGAGVVVHGDMVCLDYTAEEGVLTSICDSDHAV